MSLYRNIIKPFFDFSSALIALIIFSPLFFLITLCLFVTNSGKPFYIQARPGKNERIFNIIKFKSMNDKTDSKGELLPPDARITAIGQFIRKYSLDELPQLINVLKGEISIVGPRPLLIKYLPRYDEIQKTRHNVKPGITGWAQVNGRNAISWEKKFELDVYYVNNISFKFDLKIIFMTIKKIFKSEGIYGNDDRIVSDFKGTKSH
ncbi:MAG: sugar transferase [Flavobacteriaceae bacterium]|nr:sugar transferase [Flavobacteriaceae bacterium]